MRKLALYGKGGIGKSTTAVNLALTFANLGYKVGLIGCDPKHDTCRLLLSKRLPTLMEKLTLLQAGELSLNDIIGRKGNISCVELGGPKPGVGCAGRGIILGLEYLDRHDFFKDLEITIYDILGDVVCGGFAAPITRGYVEDVYVVTSGEQAALFAANNILNGMITVKGKVRGLVFNERGFESENRVLEKFSSVVSVPIIGEISYSPNIPRWELKGMPVVEAIPDGIEAQQFQALSRHMLDRTGEVNPTPMSDDDILEGVFDD